MEQKDKKPTVPVEFIPMSEGWSYFKAEVGRVLIRSEIKLDQEKKNWVVDVHARLIDPGLQQCEQWAADVINRIAAQAETKQT